MFPEFNFRMAGINWKKYNTVTICWHDLIMNFVNLAVVFISSLVSGPGLLWISSLVLELWQFLLIKDWPEIRQLKITLSVFFAISENWGTLGIPNLALLSNKKITNKKLLNAAKCQGYSLYHFGIIWGKPIGRR